MSSIKFQLNFYGETEESMLAMCPDKSDTGMLMYAMGICTDAQHIIETSDNETAREAARLYLNKVKYFIGEVHMRMRTKALGRMVTIPEE